MSHILISGLVSLETSVLVEGFPVTYVPSRGALFGVKSGLAGIGYNLSKALATLGDTPHLVSMLAPDLLGGYVRQVLVNDGIPTGFVTGQLSETPQSAVLHDPEGRRTIFVDPKDSIEQHYPEDLFFQALSGCLMAVLGQVRFSQPLLGLARQAGVPVACDIQTNTSFDHPYTQSYLASASILFASAEGLPSPPEDWAQRALNDYNPQVVVIGLGTEGALLAVRQTGQMQRFPAVYTRPVVNTLGAGDALFSAFIHFHCAGFSPAEALARAMVFASYKIGESGATRGFLTDSEVSEWLSLGKDS
jgi:acarbose 7IV-phosphotransferase